MFRKLSGMETLDEYIESHISPEPELLYETYRYTNNHHVYPHMCSGHVQGRVLKMLTSMIAPQRVLELGCYTGYSTLCIAEALQPGAELHTVEIDDELTDELTARFARSPRADAIYLHIGDAFDIVPSLGGGWDMVFIDANKRTYVEYFEMILPLMRPGSFILADNTLWGGKILDENARDAQTEGIRRFNDLVARDPRVETAILPLRDGLTLLRVL